MQLPPESLQTLVKVSGGDLRKAITTLQSAVRLQVSGGSPASCGMTWGGGGYPTDACWNTVPSGLHSQINLLVVPLYQDETIPWVLSGWPSCQGPSCASWATLLSSQAAVSSAASLFAGPGSAAPDRPGCGRSSAAVRAGRPAGRLQKRHLCQRADSHF